MPRQLFGGAGVVVFISFSICRFPAESKTAPKNNNHLMRVQKKSTAIFTEFAGIYSPSVANLLSKCEKKKLSVIRP